jgi:hypothetical protein
MKNKIKIATQTQTIQTLTKKMLGKNKYAFVSFPKPTLLALALSESVAIPPSFVSEITKSFLIKDPAYMKAIPPSFTHFIEKNDNFDLSLFKDDPIYFNSSTLENYYHSSKFVFNAFVEFYIKNTPFIIISFNDKKYITKLFGFPAAYIHVPYSNYYDRLDQICNSIDEVKNQGSVVMLDCPVFSAGLAQTIWNRFDLSILDLGKIVSFSKTESLDRATFNEEKPFKN